MSILDKAIAAITPPESDEARAEARAKAEAAATPGDWLSMVLDHHRQIDAAFATLENAGDAASRAAAQKALGTILTAHSIAEEVALYPALAADHQVGHAELAYQEQSAAKMEMGLLERLDPMSEDYEDKLSHIRGAVMHHVYSEEGTWFLDLADSLPAEEQTRIGVRYKEEFERYMGNGNSAAASASQPGLT
jgi:Hemerythrin HHE cation binding domain